MSDPSRSVEHNINATFVCGQFLGSGDWVRLEIPARSTSIIWLIINILQALIDDIWWK